MEEFIYLGAALTVEQFIYLGAALTVEQFIYLGAALTVEEFIYLGAALTVEEFIYLGAALTNQNSIQQEMKSRLKSGNACYHSVQNILSSSLQSKNFKDRDIKKYNFACCFIWA